ncbi:MAG TPA: autotransporter domain-containing protein, partial [Caulobacteraceae bacterium]|nr:autotransporter domain-containing protein [Caulobacteraceae bacterium]
IQTGASPSTTGLAGNGIEAIAAGTGTVSVGTAAFPLTGSVTGTQPTIALSANGIFANGQGDVNVNTASTSNVKVVQTSASPATPLLTTSWGINAISNPGGAGAGGKVTVSALGTVSGGGGIRAVANGTDAGDTVSVTTGGAVTGATGNGIKTSSASSGGTSITVNAGSVVKGLGTSATTAVIDVTTASGATTTIVNNGTVQSLSASPAAYGDLALKGTTGNVSLTNNGTLLGRVDTSGLTGANATTISNTGTWHTTGTSTFDAGADSLTNSGLLLTASGGAATTIDFGAGTDKLTNSGKFVVGETAQAASTVNLTNLETFANSGTIIFGGNATNTGSDNFINDRLITGAAFAGSGSSLLQMDANLWSDTQTDCTSLTAADCLQVGSTSGFTQIQINDTNAHALGAFNPTGIAIVKGSSAAANFELSSASEWFNAGGTNQFGGATNVLDKPGLFFYDLAFDAATNRELLIGVPKAAAFEFAALGGAASDIWYTTTQSWFDRQADLRDTVSGRPTGGAPGVWLKVVGDWTRRSSTDTFTLFNNTYTFNTGYNKDTAALIGGIDFLNVTAADHAWVLGLEGGYVDANVRFKASPDRANLTGSTLGVYGTYMAGGLFIDAIVNANFLNLDVSLPGLQTSPNPWTASGDVRNWGGQVEGGYAMPIGATAFWEPIVSLAYARSDFDDLNIPGGTQQFGNVDSFRGSIGARIGTTASYQYYKIKLALEGRVWDEFDGKTDTLLIVPGGPNFLNNDDLDGVFGEIKGEANIFAVGNNFSAFLNGGVKWKSHYQATTVTLGMRYSW